MPRVLLVERDPLIAAALEDDLRAAGYDVSWAEESTAAVDVARRRGVDAAVIESSTAQTALDTVRAFRALKETYDLPVVLLTQNDNPSRLAALRAGASEVIERPFETEELLLRLERLLGTATTPALSGDLSTHPLAELIQYIQHTGQDGELVVRSPRGSGRVSFVRGKAVFARCGDLEAAEALLTLFGTESGRFRFVVRDTAAEPPADGKSLPLVRLLLLSGWLADQLELRREWSPVTGEPLRSTGAEPPETEGDFTDLPIRRVLKQVRERPGVRLYDLLSSVDAAPRKIRLGVAWLIEHGVIAREEDERAYPTTHEIDTSVLCEIAVEQLQVTAADRGFDSSAPFLLLAETGAWEDLVGVFKSLPQGHVTAAFARLGKQLEQRRGGTVALDTRRGRLSIHVQELDEAKRLQIGSLVPACAGMLIWLHSGAAEETARSAVERLQEMEGYPNGVLVAGAEASQSLAERLAAVHPRWTMTPHAPQSLLAVLRLMRGQE